MRDNAIYMHGNMDFLFVDLGNNFGLLVGAIARSANNI